jgi:hypothetical protein
MQLNTGDLTDSKNVKVKRANSSNLEANIVFAGTVIPLIKFNVNPKQPRRKTVSVSVPKNESGKRIARAYVANLGRHSAENYGERNV